MVAPLPYYRGNDRDTKNNTPSPIRPDGLAKLHNAVAQFKIDKVSGNLADYLATSTARAARMAQPEWNGWGQYLKKSAARLSKIRATPRLRPVID